MYKLATMYGMVIIITIKTTGNYEHFRNKLPYWRRAVITGMLFEQAAVNRTEQLHFNIYLAYI